MRNLLFIIVLLVATGCSFSGKGVSHELENADALMSEDPSAAMAVLNNFDVSAVTDSSVVARWALLYSEALVANNLKAPTDTIVNIAVDYYGKHGSKDQFRHACGLKALLSATDATDTLATALYLQKEKEFFLYRERMRRQQWLILGLLILACAGGVILWQHQRLKIQVAQNDLLIAEASDLRKGIDRNESVCTDLQAKLANLLNTRFSSIDQLCQTYYESQGTKAERKAIVDTVKSQIDEMKSDTGLFAEMERCANDCRCGIIDYLHAELPAMKPEDYRLFVYLACNLSSRTIALLLGESMAVVYKRKSRLKSKISALDTADVNLFLSIF